MYQVEHFIDEKSDDYE